MSGPGTSGPTRGSASQSNDTSNATRNPIANPGDGPEGQPDRDGDPLSVFSTATDRIRRDPALVVPFVIAGIILALIDWARRRDPLPTLAPDDGGGTLISLEFAGYPTGVPETFRPLSALIDLKLPYLAWGIGLEVGAVLVVAIAGVVTIARALDGGAGGSSPVYTDRWSGRRVPAYFGLVVLFVVVGRLLGTLGDLGLIIGIPILIAVLIVLVRLFIAPAFVVTGSGPIAALRRSHRVTRGSGWSIVGLVLFFGIGAWALTLLPVPYVGTVLSAALVAPIHAVAVAVIREQADGTPVQIK